MPATRPPRSLPIATPPAVFAVVPSFHPEPALIDRVDSLAGQLDSVVVVDDGSGPGASDVLDRIESRGHTVIRLPRNAGIASALNAGIRIALDRGADLVLNVDQDSDLPENYVATAAATFRMANPVTRVGIVCVDAVNGAPALPTWISPEGLGLVPEAIQTGFLISRECLEVTGLMDERLVIDCVDTEYCLRARDHGFRIAIARGTDIGHAIGRRAELRPFGIPLRHASGRIATYQYHSPFRRYYIARNNIDLMFRNLAKRPRWVAAVAKRETGGMLTTIVSGPRRGAQLLAIVTGTFHGLIRRRGMIPRWLHRIVS